MDPRLQLAPGVRVFVFLLAVIVTGTWAILRHVPHGEATASAVVTPVRTQEVQSVAIDTPHARRDHRRLPLHELRALLTTRPGELLDEQALAADRRALEQALVSRGYLAARVAPAAVTFAANGGAYVVFDVERGPMYHLRSVTVTGPGEGDAGVVTIAAGDEAVQARIDGARQSLQEVLGTRSARSRVELYVHEDRDAAVVDVELVTTEVTVLR